MLFCLSILAIVILQALHFAEAVYLRGQKTARDVYNPTITYPIAGSTWVVGTTETVAWDTRDAPKNTTNSAGKVVLGRKDPQSSNEHLNIEHPLATDFSIFAGNVSFEVPDVPPRDDYMIVLFGDSGNQSPTFNIVKV